MKYLNYLILESSKDYNDQLRFIYQKLVKMRYKIRDEISKKFYELSKGKINYLQFETSFADGDKFLIDRLYDEDGFLYVDYSSLEEGTDEYSESTARLEDIMDEKSLIALLQNLEEMSDDDVETQIANKEGKSMGFFDLKKESYIINEKKKVASDYYIEYDKLKGKIDELKEKLIESIYNRFNELTNGLKTNSINLDALGEEEDNSGIYVYDRQTESSGHIGSISLLNTGILESEVFFVEYDDKYSMGEFNFDELLELLYFMEKITREQIEEQVIYREGENMESSMI